MSSSLLALHCSGSSNRLSRSNSSNVTQSALFSLLSSEVGMLRQFDVAHARGRELERPDGGALVVHVVRVDGEQVLECVPLHAQRLPAAVRHLQTWKHTKPLSTLSKIQYTQYELYGTGYMGHFFGLVEIYKKIRDVTSL